MQIDSRVEMRVGVLCVVLSLVVFARSQRPSPCVSPGVWSGGFMQRDKQQMFSTSGEIYYDAGDQRVAYILEDTHGQTSEKEHIIALYKEDLIYTINLDTKTCTFEALGRSFIPIQVPVNATLFGDTTLGTSDVTLGGGIEVEIWQGKFTDPEGYYEVVVTRDGCIPINDIFISDEIGTVETFFSNVVGGISDPNVFIPPGNCTKL